MWEEPEMWEEEMCGKIQTDFVIVSQESTLEVHFHLERLTLTRKEESAAQRGSETLMNRLRPLRGSSSAATLAALIGGEAPAKKEDSKSMVREERVLISSGQVWSSHQTKRTVGRMGMDGDQI